MTVDQVEFTCRTKENVGTNSMFRFRVEHELADLFNCLLNVHGGTRDPLDVAGLLSDPALGRLAMAANNYPTFSDLVLTLLCNSAGKMAAYHTPNALRNVINVLGTAPEFLPVGGLDRIEASLVVLCHNMKPLVERELSLSPLTHIAFMVDRSRLALETDFLVYEKSFAEFYAEESRLRPHRLGDRRTLEDAFGDFTNSLFDLFPHLWETLSLHRALRERYGDAAFRDRPEIVTLPSDSIP